MSDFREELAWAAGFFDGEGNIGFYQNGRYGHLRMAVSQTERTILVRFNRALQNVGRLSGPTKPQGLSRKLSWTLSIYGYEHSQAAVAMLWTWLSKTKREQAKTALGKYLAYQDGLVRPMKPWRR
jgi:hypothetical protein